MSSPLLSRGATQALLECRVQCKRSGNYTLKAATGPSCAHCAALFRELEKAHAFRLAAEAERDFYLRGVSTFAKHGSRPHSPHDSGGAEGNVTLAEVLTSLNASAAGLPAVWSREGVLRNAASGAARHALISMNVAEAHTLMQYLAGSSVMVGARKLEWDARSQSHRFVPYAARSYLEWGSGGSTELVALLASTTHGTATRTGPAHGPASAGSASLLHPAFHATSVESSRHFLSSLLERSAYVSRSIRRGRLRLLHANIGPTERLGFPASAAWRELLRRGPRAYESVAKRYVARFLPAASSKSNANGGASRGVPPPIGGGMVQGAGASRGVPPPTGGGMAPQGAAAPASSGNSWLRGAAGHDDALDVSLKGEHARQRDGQREPRREVESSSRHAADPPAPPSFDVVLVDGRWRVACALWALPLLRRPRARLGGGVLLFHDFGPPSPAAHRDEYQRALLSFYEIHRLVHSLAVLRPRPNVSADRLEAAFKAALSSPT